MPGQGSCCLCAHVSVSSAGCGQQHPPSVERIACACPGPGRRRSSPRPAPGPAKGSGAEAWQQAQATQGYSEGEEEEEEEDGGSVSAAVYPHGAPSSSGGHWGGGASEQTEGDEEGVSEMSLEAQQAAASEATWRWMREQPELRGLLLERGGSDSSEGEMMGPDL